VPLIDIQIKSNGGDKHRAKEKQRKIQGKEAAHGWRRGG